MRKPSRGAWISNNGYDRAMAIDEVASGRADLVAFGRLFLANPDLHAGCAKTPASTRPTRTRFMAATATATPTTLHWIDAAMRGDVVISIHVASLDSSLATTTCLGQTPTQAATPDSLSGRSGVNPSR